MTDTREEAKRIVAAIEAAAKVGWPQSKTISDAAVLIRREILDRPAPAQSGAKIIQALKEAIAGDFARVTIDGQVWVRCGPVDSHYQSKEHELACRLTDKVLNRPNADHDDDLAVLARQFQRGGERYERLTKEFGALQAAAQAVIDSTPPAARRVAIQNLLSLLARQRGLR